LLPPFRVAAAAVAAALPPEILVPKSTPCAGALYGMLYSWLARWKSAFAAVHTVFAYAVVIVTAVA
jgi:hypothetical protein